MVDYVHNRRTAAEVHIGGKRLLFFLPLFMNLFQHIEIGGLRGCRNSSQNSCLHERVFISLFTC